MSIDKADAKGFDFLAEHFRLWFGDCAVVGADELVEFDEDGFPLGRRWLATAAAARVDGTSMIAGVEAMLVDIAFNDGVGLNIDKVAASIGFDS